MLELETKCVIKDPITSRYILMLETICGGFIIPVPVGEFEAEAIYSELNKIPAPRPMTYDFITGIISSIDGLAVESVIIDSVDCGVYTAKLNIDIKGEKKTIDCRPSDAAALALRLDTPVYIEEEVFNKCRCIDRECLNAGDESVISSMVDSGGRAFWSA